MKGQIEKIETRSDNVIKLSITVQPEAVPANIIQWRFEMVSIEKSNEDMISIPKAEYEALTAGGAWVIPEEKRQALKTIAAMLLDWAGGN